MDFGSMVWDEFWDERTKNLWDRFPGVYRAIVVETNDPLNMRRVRFKCADLHDADLADADCPWAVPAADMGHGGRWSSPIRGDHIWIAFERGHPYGPLWLGFADPTRRRLYSLASVSNPTPASINDSSSDGSATDALVAALDYNAEYLPKDGRPMSHGWQDRYGNLDMHSAVGFYPAEHSEPPPPPGHDAILGAAFAARHAVPLINDPDLKYMVRATKYGQTLLLADQGYYWKIKPDADSLLEVGTPFGEFTGDQAADADFEVRRWLYLQRLWNEGVPVSAMPQGDQRRCLLQSRYGHKLELRDVGWGQLGPTPSMTRIGEYLPDPRHISKEALRDERWIKLRTKAGMLFQACDVGADPQLDTYIKRTLLEEAGTRSELEDKHWGGDKDARWMRLVTRHGLKIVLDDRGTDPTNAHDREWPRANGILLKGRRSPGVKGQPDVGDPRGFYWEFNENDAANHTIWGSPLGLAMEMNDRYQYLMLAAAMGPGWGAKWRGIKENEFLRKPLMLRDPERTAHHLKLDHENEYVRLKTRAGHGAKPLQSLNVSMLPSTAVQQGFEARDGSLGGGPWVELVDADNRGMWFSQLRKLGIWRGSHFTDLYIWLDEQTNTIALYNGHSAGKIKIYSAGDVEIKSGGSLSLQAARDVNILAGRGVKIQGAGTKLTVTSDVQTNAIMKASFFVIQPGGSVAPPITQPSLPLQISPDDRGATYNKPFEECPIGEVEHTIQKGSESESESEAVS